jgi:hypothetical protein
MTRLEDATSARDLLYPLDLAHLLTPLPVATNPDDNLRSHHFTDVIPLIGANQ